MSEPTHHLPPVSDGELLLQYRDGSNEALSVLFSRHQGEVEWYAYLRIGNWTDAEDVSQECWAEMRASCDRFDPALPFSPWLFNILSNLIVDFLRKKGRRREVSDPNNSLARVADHDDAAFNLEWAEFRSRLTTAINQLPDAYRDVFKARINGATFQDIANKHGITLVTARQRFHRACTNLKGDFDDQLETPEKRSVLRPLSSLEGSES